MLYRAGVLKSCTVERAKGSVPRFQAGGMRPLAVLCTLHDIVPFDYRPSHRPGRGHHRADARPLQYDAWRLADLAVQRIAYRLL